MLRDSASRPLWVGFTLLFLVVGASAATAQDPVLNEFVANHTGTDNFEYVEVFGAPSTDLSAFTVLQLEGDGSGAGVVDTVLPVGTTDAGGFWVSAFLSNELENGSMTLLLVEGFTGSGGADLDTDNDGLLDAAPWSRLVDGVAVFDGGAGDHVYAVALGPGFDGISFTPGGASRIPDGADTDSASDWVRNDFDGAGIPALDPGTPEVGEAFNTPGASNQVVTETAADPVVNEFVFNHTGTDNFEYVEVAGDPATDYSAFTVLEIEGDSSGAGVVDGVFPVGTTNADGLWFTGFLTNVLENGTVTLLLIEGFTGSAGDDLDTDNDGTLDSAPWDRIVDSVAVTDGGSSDHAYANVTLTPGFDGVPFTPGGASRIPNAVDTDSVGDWLRNDFDGAGIPALDPGTPDPGEAFNTPEAINEAVPQPVSDVFLNEIRIDQPGGDVDEYFELTAAGGTSLDRLTYLVIGDGSGGSGVIENVTSLAGRTMPADGLFVAAESSFTLGTPDLVTTLNFENSDNVTHLLVADFTGSNGQDLDTDDDGVLDAMPWSQQVDCVALVETPGSGDRIYCDTTVGPDGSFVPGHVFLCDDGWRIGGFALDATDTPGEENFCLAGTFEIYEIQGSGLASPLEGLLVTTENNVVTGVTTNGFFMQTPVARTDGDPATSDGIFVFTGGAPGVVAGDLVTVTGTVQEFFDLTEISGSPLVDVVGSGSLPTPEILDENRPSKDPTLHDLEPLEGMLVRVEDGFSNAPTDVFGDTPVIAALPRALREKGIEFPGLPGLPVWDGNPEVFEIDPNGLAGRPDVVLDSLAEIVVAEGPLTFSFGDYQILPSTLTIGDTPDWILPVRPAGPDELTVGSLNLERLFDAVDDPGPEDNGQVSTPAGYQFRLEKFSSYIRYVLRAPDILALEEAESLSVLEDLAAQIATDSSGGPIIHYSAFLVEGNDIGGIDTGFLVRDRVRVDAVTQLGAGELLSVDGSPLHDRPPLLLEGALLTGGEDFEIAVLAVHNRSLSGIDDPVDGPRVRQKRLEQAQSIAAKVQAFQLASPEAFLTVVGDFNAFQFTDGYVDVVGQIRGVFDPAENLLSGADLVDPDLSNQVLSLPVEEQYSFTFDGFPQALDHALTTVTLDPLVTGFEYGRGDADLAPPRGNLPGPGRVSDHDGLVLFVFADTDDDGVPNSADVCPGTEIPEAVPTVSLGVNRWALVDDDGIFDTVPPNGVGPGVGFTLEDTAGCSCAQIIEAQGLGLGHEKFGCSIGAMLDWVKEVSP
jgi:hypothetical protein